MATVAATRAHASHWGRNICWPNLTKPDSNGMLIDPSRPEHLELQPEEAQQAGQGDDEGWAPRT